MITKTKSISFALIFTLVLGVFSFIGVQNVSAKTISYTPKVTSAKFTDNNKYIKVTWAKNKKYDTWKVTCLTKTGKYRTRTQYKGKDGKLHWKAWSSWQNTTGYYALPVIAGADVCYAKAGSLKIKSSKYSTGTYKNKKGQKFQKQYKTTSVKIMFTKNIYETKQGSHSVI